MAKKKDPVGTYAERPYEKAVRSDEEHAAAENRPQQDQIKDYHKDHPTLKTDAPKGTDDTGA